MLEDRYVTYYVYILTTKNNTVLYTGVTRDLIFDKNPHWVDRNNQIIGE